MSFNFANSWQKGTPRKCETNANAQTTTFVSCS